MCRGAFQADVCDYFGEIGSSGGGFGIVLPDGGVGFVAAVGDVGDRGGVADRVDVGHADVRRGFEREIEAQVAAARPVLVDLNDEDIFSRDESGRREVVGGVICLTGGGAEGKSGGS